MALTESTMLPLGTQAPAFELPDTVTGAPLFLAQLAGERATLVMFICNHCPFVKHVLPGIVALANDYLPKGVAVVAISSNDALNYPGDGPAQMAGVAKQNGFGFPYLYDESQDTAKAYQAACTPDFFLFDAQLHCVYRGRMDSSKPGNDQPNDGADLRQALDALLSGQTVSTDQKPGIGCNIKWR